MHLALLMAAQPISRRRASAQVALTLSALHKVGLLRRGDARSSWPALRKVLDLVADDVHEVRLCKLVLALRPELSAHDGPRHATAGARLRAAH